METEALVRVTAVCVQVWGGCTGCCGGQCRCVTCVALTQAEICASVAFKAAPPAPHERSNTGGRNNIPFPHTPPLIGMVSATCPYTQRPLSGRDRVSVAQQLLFRTGRARAARVAAVEDWATDHPALKEEAEALLAVGEHLCDLSREGLAALTEESIAALLLCAPGGQQWEALVQRGGAVAGRAAALILPYAQRLLQTRECHAVPVGVQLRQLSVGRPLPGTAPPQGGCRPSPLLRATNY